MIDVITDCLNELIASFDISIIFSSIRFLIVVFGVGFFVCFMFFIAKKK